MRSEEIQGEQTVVFVPFARLWERTLISLVPGSPTSPNGSPSTASSKGSRRKILFGKPVSRAQYVTALVERDLGR